VKSTACTECGVDFVHRRSDARYCSARCRQRAHERRSRPSMHPIADTSSASPLVAAVERDLQANGALETLLGVLAVNLATCMVNGNHTGSSYVALAKELRATMTAAVGTSRAPDLIDELKRRRDAKRGVTGF
jgi:hypothetical protein